jgi:apolipoprotein D and lipocalin family protein
VLKILSNSINPYTFSIMKINKSYYKVYHWIENIFRTLFLFALALIHFQCNNVQDLNTVSQVDLNKYVGKWYEIAAFPQSFQKDCYCSTAEYTLSSNKEYVEIENSCNKDSIQGKQVTIKGKAFVEKNSGNARLQVQFFWPFRGKYWIIDLADDYSYAVIGHPNRDYLWILSRTPAMAEPLYQEILNRVQTQGFDIRKIKKTVQVL